MNTAKGIKKAVRANERYIDIPSRSHMDNMVYFVADLLKESGDVETAAKVREFYGKLEDMDTAKLVKERIWIG